MPSSIFKRADTRFLAAALASETTHGGIDQFQLTLDLKSENLGNKAERSSLIVKHIFEQPNTDELIIDLLNFLFVENPYVTALGERAAYRELQSNVLGPRGVTHDEDGFALPDGRGADQLRTEREKQSAGAISDWLLTGREAEAPPAAEPLFATPRIEEAVASVTLRQPSKVFVVHGRDMRPVDALKQYLTYLHLEMLSWSDARALTKESQPHTYDVVNAGMSRAAAVVVIFSPDDEARLKREFAEDGDPELVVQGQARQNVLVEAGMAFAMARDRTIFLRSGTVRPISDIAGFNWVKLDGEYDSRKDLKERLETAGAKVRTGDYNLLDAQAGPFRAS